MNLEEAEEDGVSLDDDEESKGISDNLSKLNKCFNFVQHFYVGYIIAAKPYLVPLLLECMTKQV